MIIFSYLVKKFFGVQFSEVVLTQNPKLWTINYFELLKKCLLSLHTMMLYHDGDFKHPERRTATELSSHIWDLKDKDTPYNIQWEIVRRANPFSPITKRCELCLAEKLEIIYNPGMATLNKRHEVFNHCRHRVAKLLVKRKRRRRIPGD